MKTINPEKLTQAPANDGIWEILGNTKERTFNTDIEEATTVERYMEENHKVPLEVAYDKVNEANETIIAENARVLREMSKLFMKQSHPTFTATLETSALQVTPPSCSLRLVYFAPFPLVAFRWIPLRK